MAVTETVLMQSQWYNHLKMMFLYFDHTGKVKSLTIQL